MSPSERQHAAAAEVAAAPTGPPADAVPRPAHLDPALIAVVALGGFGGAVTRYGVVQLLGARPWPVAVWSINLLGAFLLGLLTAWLAARGADEGRRRTLRLLLGTGFMGAFTTYSALAVDTERLWASGRVGAAALYAGSTLVLGLLASLAGIAAGGAAGRARWGAR